MASNLSFTLDDDDEDSQAANISSQSMVAVEPSPIARPAAASTAGAPPSAPLLPPSSGSLNLFYHATRPSPKALIDTDLGVCNLAQAIASAQQNQKQIEETEARLQELLKQQARLVAAGRLLEQQKVLDVLALGPELGYDNGRPTAALIVYRCCLRWGSFGSDSQAATVLDHLTALLTSATDDDTLQAKHTAAVARTARGTTEVQTGSDGGYGGAEGPAEQAAAAATREMAYWLAVTSTLLALVDPHLPLAAPTPRTAEGSSTVSGAAAIRQALAETPLAAVAVDARASVARAASAAAAKVQELHKRMGTTFSGMQLLGKNLLARRRGGAAGQGGGEVRKGSSGGEGDGNTAAEPQHVVGGAPAPGEASGEASGGSEAELLPKAATGAASAAITSSFSTATVPLPPANGQPSPASASTALAAASRQSFRASLDLLLTRTYNQMRDNLKRHVSAVLPGCVQLPQPQLMSPRDSGPVETGPDADASMQTQLPGAATEQDVEHERAPLQSWRDLVAVLAHHLAMMHAAHVPRIMIRCLFKQTLAFIDGQLFNQLLLRPECCATSNARYLLSGLQLLEAWLAGPQAAGGAGDLALLTEDLRHIRQAAHFLALANKAALRLDDITGICPALNAQQLYRLATTFWDDSPPPPPTYPQPKISMCEEAASGTGTDSGAPEEPAGLQTDAASVSADNAVVMPEESHEDEREGGEKGIAATSAHPSKDSQDAAGGFDDPSEAADVAKHSTDAARVLEEAAAAAVAAAAAAAAADEAADAPAPPIAPSPEAAAAVAAAAAAVTRNVSGEVLEEMKRRHAVANNGGLIVTFLLDEDNAPLIAPGGAVSRQLLQLINEPRLHEGLVEGLPAALKGEDCPTEAFAFLLREVQLGMAGVADSVSVDQAVVAGGRSS